VGVARAAPGPTGRSANPRCYTARALDCVWYSYQAQVADTGEEGRRPAQEDRADRVDQGPREVVHSALATSAAAGPMLAAVDERDARRGQRGAPWRRQRPVGAPGTLGAITRTSWPRSTSRGRSAHETGLRPVDLGEARSLGRTRCAPFSIVDGPGEAREKPRLAADYEVVSPLRCLARSQSPRYSSLRIRVEPAPPRKELPRRPSRTST